MHWPARPPIHTPAQARFGAQQHQQTQHALQLKIGLLEEQLGATAASARRRMEEQLDSFRSDAITARWAVPCRPSQALHVPGFC